MEQATFYAWMEAGPSSMTVRISGGERQQDAKGTILATPMHEVHFNDGIYRTASEEEIKVLRAMVEKGDNITEDREVYLNHALSKDKQLERNQNKASRLTTENNDLRAQLEAEKAKNRKKEPVTA